jgi:hypothetical protein
MDLDFGSLHGLLLRASESPEGALVLFCVIYLSRVILDRWDARERERRRARKERKPGA